YYYLLGEVRARPKGGMAWVVVRTLALLAAVTPGRLRYLRARGEDWNGQNVGGGSRPLSAGSGHSRAHAKTIVYGIFNLPNRFHAEVVQLLPMQTLHPG